MRVYDGELCECGCSLMETQFGLFCPECGKVVCTFDEVINYRDTEAQSWACLSHHAVVQLLGNT